MRNAKSYARDFNIAKHAWFVMMYKSSFRILKTLES